MIKVIRNVDNETPKAGRARSPIPFGGPLPKKAAQQATQSVSAGKSRCCFHLDPEMGTTCLLLSDSLTLTISLPESSCLCRFSLSAVICHIGFWIHLTAGFSPSRVTLFLHLFGATISSP